jgi:tetratricopeptide (TPR) repeat protein
MRIIRWPLAVAALMLMSVAASAQTPEQLCAASDVTPQRQIAGCTALIKSHEFHGEKLAGIYNRRGIAYTRIREYDKAIADYNEAILHDISNSDVFYNRGLAYRRKGDFDHAITDHTRAITGYDPARHPLYYKRDYFKARGDAYGGKEDFPHAVADYDEAVKLDPKFARALYNRGVAKQKLGDNAGGDADIAQAKTLQDDIGPEE